VIRVILFFIVVGLLALGGAWFADRPGGVEIVWLGYRITTSVAVLAAAIAVLVIAVMLLLWLLATIVRSPGRWSRYLRRRREERGQHAISRGLIAVGAGDLRAARKFATEAQRYATNQPLTLLLAAQSAQLAGDRASAEQTFSTMAGRADLKLIGLHGLYVEARRRGDAQSAGVLAEQAARAEPGLAWAGQAVLEIRCAAGDWREALAALERNMAAGLVEKDTYRRQRAVLLTAQAMAESDRDSAKTAALEAAKLAPNLVPAAALAGRFLAEAGEQRKAARIIETAWLANPHPDLAEAYINLRPGDSARERFARAQRLADDAPGNVESAFAIARAAIDASEFAQARAALAPLLVAPTQRVALLMAEIEEAEGDVGRARSWTARAVRAAPDPVWTADGFTSRAWRPLSPSGRLDAFEWRVPVSALPGAIIDEAAHAGESATAPAAQPKQIEAAEIGTPRTAKSETPTNTVGKPAAAPSGSSPPPASTQAVLPADRGTAAPPANIDAIIPLVHAPDDPGPELADIDEPKITQKSGSWQRLRAFFS
jgi:HemY protein